MEISDELTRDLLASPTLFVDMSFSASPFLSHPKLEKVMSESVKRALSGKEEPLLPILQQNLSQKEWEEARQAIRKDLEKRYAKKEP